MTTTAEAPPAETADEFFVDPVEAPLDSIVSGLEYVESEVRRLEALRMGLYAQAARISEQGGDLGQRAVRAEIATALHTSEYLVNTQLMLGAALMRQYPTVHTALEFGEVSHAHANVIVDAGTIIGVTRSHIAGGFDLPDVSDDELPPDAVAELEIQVKRAEYAARVLEYAVRETPGRLRPIARRIAEEYAKTSIDERHQTAVTRRKVSVYDAEDGMADLYAHLPRSRRTQSMTGLHRRAERLNSPKHLPRWITLPAPTALPAQVLRAQALLVQAPRATAHL